MIDSSYEKNIEDKDGNIIASFNYPQYVKTYQNLDVYITYKGEKYNEKDLDLISEKVYKKKDLLDQKTSNSLANRVINSKNSFTESELNEIRDVKKKMEANSWVSRQRSLRRKGKLEQYKIDMLNSLGMLWNPKKDSWEIMFSKFKKYSFIDDVEEWVFEQRELYKSGKITDENKSRLISVNFPFEAKSDEKYEFTTNTVWKLKEKLEKKIRRLELKLINNPPKKLTEKQKQIIERENKEIKKKKNHKKNTITEKEKKERKIINSLYQQKYIIANRIEKGIPKLSVKESKLLINKILNGANIYYNENKLFLDEVVNKKLLGHFTRSFVKKFYDDLQKHISKVEIYTQLNIFNSTKVKEEVRIYACKKMLDFIKFLTPKEIINLSSLNFLIRHYKKQKNYPELENLKTFLQKSPAIYELYKDKF